LSPLEGYFTSRLWDDDDLGALSFPVQDCLATFRNIIDHRENLHGLTNLCDSALISWTKGGALQPEVQEQIVRVLLERGVDIAWRDSSGKNVWHYLASGSRIVKSRILKTCADFLAVMSTIDIADDLGFTPVLEAVEANDIEMFDFLIGQGCSVTSKTHKGESILHLSAAGVRSDDAILQRTLTKYTHTKIATSTFDGSTVAHYCVKFITEPDYGNFPPSRMPGLFKDAIEALEASSISTTETDSEGRTALDRLCQWIADHSSSNNYHCDVCLECFEVLVAHDDAVKTGVTWAAILLRGLALKAQSSDIHPAVKYSWESDNVCSRAVCLAIDRGVPLDDLGSDLDLDSIFDIAVQLREESLILKLLDIGSIDFDKPSRKEPHHTPLQSLCAHCCPASTIRVAISRTRDVCGSDPQGLGPLHMLFSNAKAQHKNMAPSIRALLDAGVDIDGNTNESGHTALMMAAASRISSDAVGTLLSSGAKVDLLNDDGWNALLYACAYGTESAIHELIDAGSAILHKTANLPDLHIEIPLCGPMQLAAGRGMSNIVQSLLQAERSVEKSDNNTTPTSPLLTACVGGDVETVRLLLEHGYDPNLLDVSLGLRPLHLASRAGDTQIVRALLDGGCDKEAPNKEGLTAWMLAMIEGRTDVADILERFEGRSSGQAVSLIRPLRPAEHRNSGSATNNDSGDSTHSRSMTSYAVHQPPFGRDVVHNTLPDGMRPFFEQGSLHVIEKFVKGGLDMEGRFKSCTCTPMLAAVIYDSLEIVEYLISIGVSLFTKDTCSLHLKYNDTVAELLAEGPVWTRLVEQYFRQPEWRAQLSQSSLFGMIACAIASGNFDTLDVLLDTVASPFPPSRITLWNILSSELLNQAAESTGTSAISCATMLLSRGLDVDHMDRNGSTPLQIAALYGHLDMITLFLSYGATLDVGTPVKCTALAIAAREGHVSIVNYLLASGAHPNFCLEPSISPVTLAAKNGEYVIFRALLEAGGTARAQDCYALCGSGYRSVLMLDEPYLCAMQGPDLLHYNCALAKLMPFLKVMPLARRALCFATLHPTEKITALYDAAIHGIVRFVDFALRYGAVINMEGGPEGTPLMAACAAGHASISKRLVRCGALLTYWNGTSHVSAFVKAQHHPKILRWLLAGRFTETLRLMENPSGEDLHLDTTVTTHGRANDVRVELILKHDIENYLERNFWFVSPRRFVDSGHGSFDELDILPSEFAKYKPGFA
jgi:ankyrin repeat protein